MSLTMVDPTNLDEAIARIRKRYGAEAVMPASQKSEVKRIPFGDIQLDWATDGGVPLGRWSHFYGPESAGKSLLSLKVIGNAQRMGMSAAYYDVEKTFVPSWAQKMGVDIDKLLVLRPTVIEDIGAQLELLMQSINVHVIDSIAAASPMDELAANLEDWHIGLGARTWNKVLRRIQHVINDDNSVILINQLRTAMRGRIVTEEPSGGKFMRHEAALALEMKKGPRLYYTKNKTLSPDGEKTDSPTGDVAPDGIEFITHIAKSKVGGAGRSARMRLDFTTGQFDELWSLAMFATYFSLVERNGAWYTIGKEKVQGETGLKNYIKNNPEFEAKIRSTVMELS